MGDETMMRKAIIAGSAILAACNAPAEPQKPTASEIFALRTECGKLGKAWLDQHPLPKDADYHDRNTANVIYDSTSNRCWIAVERAHWGYIKVDPRNSAHLWPEWASNKFSIDAAAAQEIIYDAQTGARVMTCNSKGYMPQTYNKSECYYILQIKQTDLGPNWRS